MSIKELSRISRAIVPTPEETPEETQARIDSQWLEAMRTWQEADEADGGYTIAGDAYEITAQPSQRAA